MHPFAGRRMSAVNRHIAVRDAPAAQRGNGSRKRRDIRSLSVRLDYEQYQRLQQFLSEHQDETGEKISYQAILELALAEYLEEHDPPLC